MKMQAYLFMGVSTFFGLAAALYAYWAWAAEGHIEWTGTVALIVSIGFGWMVGFWLWQAARRSEKHHGLAPEDRLDGDIAENAGEYGFFSPHSWWPLFVAMAVAFTAVGVAIGWWMVFIGGFAIILTAIGWVFEYYRKEFQH
ncbi:cytochrome c oxidase subunit 4 [Nocardiopsis sp. RSe5-2]|uniref:Cytochrome c oxidase polypeptide 4 n=1 Tax=Nocardiopsis endophytica TaxID=3018445 RepID=A0ABT4UB15_9ACTN|nr:cytochrome c oxidase subunit 4 [Nocardiopsis endophytica]MDA2814169.1 cytochrome c oxidase subunit 4 [Nocardiopsis endophytica]